MNGKLAAQRFIVLEGLDGSGKSTQAQRLSELIKNSGFVCHVTSEPSENPVGGLIRRVLAGELTVESETLALLFAADRFQHYHEEISPRLEKGEYVICDRYYYSHMAYQGTDAGALNRIMSYNQAVMGASEKRPDIVFFLDASPEACLKRITASRSGKSIFETQAKLTRVREVYFATFEMLKDTENIKIIDSEGVSEEEVTKLLWSMIC